MTADIAAPPPRQVRVVDAPMVEPSAGQGLLEVVKRRYLLRLLVERELAARYEGSVLGFLWSYINPLSQFFIYFYIMGKMLHASHGFENYPIHIFSGIMVTSFFIETFNAGTASIVRNKGLIQKQPMPLEMFPVAAMLVSFWHVLPEMGIIIVLCLMDGWTPSVINVAATVLALAISMVLGTALALIFSIANVFWRDFGSVVGIISSYVRFGVPMLYPYYLVAKGAPHWLAEVYLADPIAIAVLLIQRAFWVDSTPDPKATLAFDMPTHLMERGLISLGACLVVLLLSQLFFDKYAKKVPERMR